ncbi:glutamate racemase [Niveispirillum lacus]|uniref:Glutamate racemase n=1 Tax=Niveispirillum lacus TaxID=1981099 RepID=A0A255Z5D7_9PROT|nr:glutamate racemase [Niveispirillum lacus]OYQ35850.1 glutamate racemase [Niveispirillum lacus]
MIGAFDSGHGGLTVLRALHQHLPTHDFLYLGDHADAPYGDRTPDEIYDLTLAGVSRLFDRGARLVILACNTASAVALRRLQQTWLDQAWPGRRVLGVLVPMVEAVTGVPWMADVATGRQVGDARTIGIFATSRTVDSRAYPREIAARAPEIRVVQQACPDLVPLIELGASHRQLAAAVRRYTDALMIRLEGVAPQAVMLGCTHYPLVADLFAASLPAGVEVLSQPDLTAKSLSAYLQRHPEFDQPGQGQVRFMTTGDAVRITDLATRFFGKPAQFTKV